ncbi:protein shisa-5 [Chanos chanos]|uniref:Protein shisa-5 n=1 Tax=Chanos chanos TaxID=29144 RepID=A0A6J2VKP5_CHACN|nr:protein shisa-5-like [Chanos chanos]
MASYLPVIVMFCGLLVTALAGDDCEGYYSSSGRYESKKDCSFMQFCCGTCDNRYCCSSYGSKLSEYDQDLCTFGRTETTMEITAGIVGVIVLVVVVVVCCVCPCCCIYKMCRKPRPVVATATHTTVINTQYPQQQQQTPNQGAQYPGYQPVPAQPGFGGQPAYGTPGYGAQPGYGGQPMPTAPYQAQPYAPGPPPPYQEAAGPGYPAPYSQAAYTAGQLAYPLQPPVAPPPSDYNASQPAYNPAYVEPGKSGQ